MKVYNLENIKSATELKHRTEVISMNERSIIVTGHRTKRIKRYIE